MNDTASDDEFKAEIEEITDPVELLRILVNLERQLMGIGDPYYKDLYLSIINRAEVIVKENS